MPASIILAQGDELTTGQTVDTNSNFLAERLWELGLPVRRVVTVPDRIDDLVAVIAEAARLGAVVVCTGGLGPTRDDLTAEAAASAFDLPITLNEHALAHVTNLYAALGRTVSDANRKQALLPAGCGILDNPHGTACGFTLEQRGAVLYFLPGVPREMRPMFLDRVEPDLRARFHLEPPVRRVVRVIGVPEATLEMRLRDLAATGLTVSFRTKLPENQVKLLFDAGLTEAQQEAALREVLDRIGPRAYGVDSGDLAEVVGGLLVERGETVALAESCTAGKLASWVGGVAGASRYLLEGAVVYSNEAKTRTCGVPIEVLAEHGAVSEPVARLLAEGIRARAGSTWGIGITGVAGPSGGTPEKPVGTVHVALAGPGGTEHGRYMLPGDRDRVTTLAAAAALTMLFLSVRGHDPGSGHLR